MPSPGKSASRHVEFSEVSVSGQLTILPVYQDFARISRPVGETLRGVPMLTGSLSCLVYHVRYVIPEWEIAHISANSSEVTNLTGTAPRNLSEVCRGTLGVGMRSVQSRIYAQ
jgi:hypothetical protein